VHDTPPKLPRVRRFIAVDETVRDRLMVQEGIAESLIEVVYNGVDMDRFQPRPPLPQRPQKALVISNYLEPSQLNVISTACQRQGIELDAIGAKLGGSYPRPEDVMGKYDVVFAKGRCAWESLAIGAAVIVCDTWGVGPIVTTTELTSLRRANFGRRLLQQPLHIEAITRELSRYDAADAGEVSRQIRATASVDLTVDRLLECYAAAIKDHGAAPTNMAADMRATAAFLQSWPAMRCLPVSDSDAAIERTLWIIRDELKRERRTTGLRKWFGSIQKWCGLPALPSRAA
jgi:hypothetical protein